MRTFPSLLALTAGLHVAAASLALAQTPAAPAAVPAAAVAQAASATAVDDYAYRPDSRRDPFISLVNAGTDVRPPTPRRIDGPATFMVGDISVRGVMQTREALVAMVQGPDNRTYLVHQGDKLADGVIKTVTPQGLVVMQDINDPLSTQKQREVRKLLRSLEDTKE